MSDENNAGTPVPAAQNSSSEQMIPKSRFDEVIAQKRQALEAAATMQQMVQTMANAQKPRQQVKEDPILRQLREKDPEMYELFSRQQRELETVRGSQSQMIEQNDRQEFFSTAGKNAEKYADKVEAVIRAEREQGNYNVKRSAVYAYIRGQEAIQRDFAPAPTEEYVPTTAQAAEAAQTDAPSSNPNLVAPKNSSTAAITGEESREERINKLKDIIF